MFKVDSNDLTFQANVEIQAIEALKALAVEIKPQVEKFEATQPSQGTLESDLWTALEAHPEGQPILEKLEAFLDEYGYLSEIATDISIPTWQENPQPVKALLSEFIFSASQDRPRPPKPQARPHNWKIHQIQTRLDLKGQVNEVYNRLLAALRECFIIQEKHWLGSGDLAEPGDIFFLTWEEVQAQLKKTSATPWSRLQAQITLRKQDWQTDSKRTQLPYLVYGNAPLSDLQWIPAKTSRSDVIQGIGASPGQVEGEIRILNSLNGPVEIDRHTILVVPYTDAGWAPLLARTGGLIAEVGGQLSHGAIVAREYGIPAIMDVTDATHRLVNGQRVRIDGQLGTIEIL